MKLKSIHEEAKRCIKNNFWKLLFITLINALISIAFTKISENFETSIFKIVFLIFSYIITIPLSYGVVVSYMKSSNNESFTVFDFISDGLKSFKRIWAVFGRTVLKLIIPVIILIIACFISIVLFSFAVFNAFSGGSSTGTIEIIISAALIIASTVFYIAKAISYSLTSYILYDNPDLSAKEIVEESAIMMKGNKMSLIKVAFYVVVLYAILFAASVLIMYLVPNFVGPLIAIALMIAATIVLLPYSMGLQIAFYNILKSGTSTDTNAEVIPNNEN